MIIPSLMAIIDCSAVKQDKTGGHPENSWAQYRIGQVWWTVESEVTRYSYFSLFRYS